MKRGIFVQAECRKFTLYRGAAENADWIPKEYKRK